MDYGAFTIALLLFDDVSRFVARALHYKNSKLSHFVKPIGLKIGRYYLFTYSLLYIVDYCTGHALVFSLLKIVLTFFGIIFIFFTFLPMGPGVGKMLMAVPIFPHHRYNELLNYKFGFLLIVPGFIVCLMYAIIQKILSILSYIEFFKTIFIKVSRTKIELSQVEEQSQIGSSEEIDEYIKVFSEISISQCGLIESVFTKELEIVSKEINAWIDESEDDQTIAIIGDNGIGKSVFLNRIHEAFNSISIVRITIPPKITKNQELNDLLATSLGVSQNEDTCIKMIKKLNEDTKEKILVIVDDAHHLFISEIDGLTAYRTFLGIISLKTENIFWIAAFNQYAFSYLKGVSGFAQNFRSEIFLGKWPSESVHKLIQSRHMLTNYQISYDKIGQYALLSDVDDIESKMELQFHNIIWEQAGGNPRVSMQLWLSSLTHSKFKTLQVSLPDKISNEQLLSLDDNAWFVLAAITRHRSLLKKETSKICNFSMPIVSHALKVALDNGIVIRTKSKRYQLSFLYHTEIVKNLKMKNFII